MAATMYPVFQPHYSIGSMSTAFGYPSSSATTTQQFLVEPLPVDGSFSFSQSLQQQQQQQHPFFSALHLQSPLPTVPEELRCQYSSKRCENRRTNKKSGGLHKFCAVHREKANRNQMRLDHRRRVLKRLAEREKRSNSVGTPTSASGGSPRRQRRSSTSRADAANDEFILKVEDDLEIDLMPLALHSQNAAPNAQPSSMFDPQDLCILEALLFSDEDQQTEDGGDEALRGAAPVCLGECCSRAASPTSTASTTETPRTKAASAWPTTTLQL